MAGDVLPDCLAHGPADVVGALAELVVDRGRLQLYRYAVDLALSETREVQRRLAQGLGRDHAKPGHGYTTDRLPRSFDEGDALAQVRRLRSGLLSSGAGTNDDQVEWLDVRLELPRHDVQLLDPTGGSGRVSPG
jgi:hypothetical protein